MLWTFRFGSCLTRMRHTIKTGHLALWLASFKPWLQSERRSQITAQDAWRCDFSSFLADPFGHAFKSWDFVVAVRNF